MDQTTAPHFPCDFPVKVIGKDEAGFEDLIQNIFQKHFPEQPVTLTKRESGQQNFIALTATVHTESQAELDALYQTLTNTPEVLVAL